MSLYNFRSKVKLSNLLVWSPLYLIFLFLGVDELSQFHESASTFIINADSQVSSSFSNVMDLLNFESAFWLILYILLGVFFIAYITYLIRHIYSKFSERRKMLSFLVSGSLLFVGVLVLELLGTTGEYFWLNESYQTLITLEESFEIFGGSLFLFFAIELLKSTRDKIRAV